MADDKKTVELEIVANAESVSRELDKTARKAAEIGKTDAKFGKIAEKHQKEKAKLDQKLNNPRKQKKAEDNVKAATRQEKQKLRLYESQTKELQKHYSLMQKIANAANGKGPKDPTPRRGQGPASPNGGGGSQMAMMSSLGTAVAGAVVAAAGLAIGAVSRQISSGFDAYVEYGKARAGLAGTGATAFEADMFRDSGQKYGYAGAETLQQARQAARATGQAGAVTTAQAMSRATTMDVGESTALMQTLTQAGQGFGGKAGTKGFKELQKAVALGTNAGMDKARIPEFMQGIGKVVQLQAGRQGGDVSSMGFANILQAMGATGASGLQGQRGASVLAQLNEAIVKPGGGEAGQALMLQAMGFGVPGGDASYYEALRQQEKGASDPENIKRLFEMTRSQYDNGEEQILALREMTGLSITQLEDMRDAVQNLSGDDREEKLAELIKDTKPIEDQALDEMKELGKVAEKSAEFQNRLVRIGDESYAAMVGMQEAINTMVSTLLPTAIDLLTTLSNLLTGLAERFHVGDKYMKAGQDVFANQGVLGANSDPYQGSAYGTGLTDIKHYAALRSLPPEQRQRLQEALDANDERGSSLRGKMAAAMSTETRFDDDNKFVADMLELNRQLVQNANKMAEQVAEAERQRNTGPAVQSLPSEPNMSVDVRY